MLERQVNGSWETVSATLTSENPLALEITDETTTTVQFTFSAQGDVISLGEGTLNVTIGVDDLVCEPGTASCDGDDLNGCEASLDSEVTNCGACGNSCPNRPGSMPVCEAGSCDAQCFPGRLDCDLIDANGCEIDSNTNLTNCGSCGLVCPALNGSPMCVAGMCQVGTCNPGFANCDGSPTNGCEFLSNTNPACGTASFAGTINGDVGGNTLNLSGNTERRYRLRINEADSGSTARQLSVRFQLTNPPGATYSLEASCDNCAVQQVGAGQVTLRWDEATVLGLPTGDSSRDVYVNVVYAGGSSCQNWTLQALGNVSTGAVTCPTL